MTKTGDHISWPVQPEKKVVGVLEILGEHDVAVVEEGGELPDGEVPHAPRVLELVGEAGVQDQAPER